MCFSSASAVCPCLFEGDVPPQPLSRCSCRAKVHHSLGCSPDSMSLLLWGHQQSAAAGCRPVTHKTHTNVTLKYRCEVSVLIVQDESNKSKVCLFFTYDGVFLFSRLFILFLCIHLQRFRVKWHHHTEPTVTHTSLTEGCQSQTQPVSINVWTTCYCTQRSRFNLQSQSNKRTLLKTQHGETELFMVQVSGPVGKTRG